MQGGANASASYRDNFRAICDRAIWKEFVHLYGKANARIKCTT